MFHIVILVLAGSFALAAAYYYVLVEWRKNPIWTNILVVGVFVWSGLVVWLLALRHALAFAGLLWAGRTVGIIAAAMALPSVIGLSCVLFVMWRVKRP